MKLRFVPDTVFGRLVSALLIVVGIAFLVIVALIVRERRELLFWGGEAAAIADVVADVSIAVATLDGEARAAELARLSAEPIAISRSGNQRPVPFGRREYEAAVGSLRSRLERDLGADYAVSVQRARPGPPGDAGLIRVRTRPAREFERRAEALRALRDARGGRQGRAADSGAGPPAGARLSQRLDAAGGGRELDVRVTLPDGATIAFRTDVPRAGPPLPRGIFLQLGLLTAALAVALYLMARTITRPLTELARAADAVGRGEPHSALAETGARELREATHAFNVMQERLHRYLASRTNVLAAMSHDLRTPLTRLKLRVETLDDAAQRERFNADLDEMNAMVTSALDLFKGLNADEPLQSIELGALIDNLRREFAELGAEVSIVGDVSARAQAKPHALKRCLTNLVGNAVKYSGAPVTLAVEDGAELVIRVLDDGPGIPDASLEEAFNPFFRLESSRNAATGGTGLGLGIARDIAQAHGGSLVLRNRTPHGLEAELRLPKRAAAG
jgi:signal transduction histidine kinase